MPNTCDEAAAASASLQLCPTLCDPIDSSPPGSPVPGILQARTLEWVAIAFSGRLGRRPEKGRGRPGDETNTQVMPIGFVIESVSPKHIDTLPTPPPVLTVPIFCLLITLSALEYFKELLESTLLVLLIILKFKTAENKILIDVRPGLISLSDSVIL